MEFRTLLGNDNVMDILDKLALGQVEAGLNRVDGLTAG